MSSPLAAFAPWREQLEILDPAMQVGLGPLVSRLALLVGALRTEGGGRSDEPDGFDGLERRGSYERLLASEWLLATELPDEFLRRAAEREHLFHRLARARPAGSRRSVVLFDGGPDQLGSPRVTQLAALLMFAARAEKAGARFGWGVVQGQSLFEEVTPASAAQLLAARTVRDSTEAHLLGWRERLGAPKAADDLWVVGGRSLGSLEGARALPHLCIEDVLVPLARRVRVSVVLPTKAQSRGVELELPAPAVCVRVLRDPFAVRSARRQVRPSPMSSGSNLLFSARGSHLLGRSTNGSAWVQPLPNSPAATPGNPIPISLEGHEQLLAAGYDRHRGYLLVLRGGQPVLRAVGRRGGPSGLPVTLEWRGVEPLDPGNPGGRLHPLLCHRIGSGTLRSEERFALTAGGELLSVRLDRLVPLASGVVAVAPYFGQIAWAAEGSEGAPGRCIEIHDGFAGSRLPVDLGSHPSMEVFFGFGGGHNHPQLRGIAAVRLDAETWRLICGGADSGRELSVRFGRVVGAARDGKQAGAPALVVLDDDRRSLWVVSSGGQHCFHRSRTEVVEVTCSHAEAVIAWTTATGELVAWALDDDRALMRLQGESK